MTREEMINRLEQIEKDIWVCSLDSTFEEESKSCAIRQAIEELKSKWIPCSERLPYLDNPKTIEEAHKGCAFLTTLSTGSVVITKRKFYVSGQHGEHLFGTWGWSRRGKTKVVAWQPLPESYKGGEE